MFMQHHHNEVELHQTAALVNYKGRNSGRLLTAATDFMSR